jgi:transcription elongation factor Elf1
MSCPFCGHEEWQGWDERVGLDTVIGSGTVDRRSEAFPLTCGNCGFIRLQASHVLDDPRDEARNTPGD